MFKYDADRKPSRITVNQLSGKYLEKSGTLQHIYLYICIAFAGVMIFYYAVGGIGTLEIRGLFVMATMVLCFFPNSQDKRWKQIVDIILLAASIVVGVYFITHNYEMKLAFFNLPTEALVMGSVMIVLIL